MDFVIDQKIQAAIQPLIARISSLEEEAKMMRNIIQEMSTQKNMSKNVKPMNPAHMPLADQHKYMTDKREEKKSMDMNKTATMDKTMARKKDAMENKHMKTQGSMMRKEMKKPM